MVPCWPVADAAVLKNRRGRQVPREGEDDKVLRPDKWGGFDPDGPRASRDQPAWDSGAIKAREQAVVPSAVPARKKAPRGHLGAIVSVR